MLQSIKRGVLADRSNPQFHICLIHFLQYGTKLALFYIYIFNVFLNIIYFSSIAVFKKKFLVKDLGEICEPAKTVIDIEMKNIYQGKTALHLNEEFLSQNSDSLEHRLAGNF